MTGEPTDCICPVDPVRPVRPAGLARIRERFGIRIRE